ncbi:Phospho-2-dehydro-3-deoxyheptonate aldolase, Tyr-sensitive [Planctopirus ephydatiae]|uniref:Phospho-2-dehydro-3-deoxyheptonate aldolase n=2 Tax=Planctopirus TaxID=1649480 RepID=A0A518GKC6_9PLAN|nr:Phospho-2-dehydro-3-deoxyheptonate aldolase, Tyr-sensitive [Planctopirus ephydatiae]
MSTVMQPLQNVNVRDTVPLIAPRYLKSEETISDSAMRTVVEGREAIKRILSGEDSRLFVTVGPCSIHDHVAALEYARKLRELAEKVKSHMLIVMRVYFEKPRTTVGWKGLINDPHLNETFDIATGLRAARRILLEVNDMGLPAATELLESITPQYISDLLAFAAIGARTTESPTHRQMASGLSMPVGYKNGTDGTLQVALDAMQAARTSHSFLGIDSEGKTCIINTKGNPWGMLVLRGGRTAPNYAPENVQEAVSKLRALNLCDRIMVDCSHANSNKDYTKQHIVWNDVIQRRLDGETALAGVMVESNLFPGSQPLKNPADLKYGVSITDGCIGWEETEELILSAYEKMNPTPAEVTA